MEACIALFSGVANFTKESFKNTSRWYLEKQVKTKAETLPDAQNKIII